MNVALSSSTPVSAGAWTLVRRPLLLMLVLGCAVSLGASGRFTLRLILDGALSFAFIPLCELAGFALVYQLRRPALPFADAVDRFFAGNTPWLWFWLTFMIAGSVIPVLRHGEIMSPLLITSLIPIVFSVFIDTRFFRGVMGRSRGRARIDVALQRMVAWPTAIAYFIGYASSSRTFFYLFVEIWDEIVAWVSKWT